MNIMKMNNRKNEMLSYVIFNKKRYSLFVSLKFVLLELISVNNICYLIGEKIFKNFNKLNGENEND